MAHKSMDLYLPFIDQLPSRANVLIAGMGGGFDVYCGLPIYFALKAKGHNVHLASLSFANLHEYGDCERLSPTLIAATPAPAELAGYHPERFLARWLHETGEATEPVWCIEPTGAHTVHADIALIHHRLRLDGVILVDGGIDSLTRGDEEMVGTVLEDYVSLAAVDMLTDIPLRILASIGMGIEGDVSCSCVLENIAALTGDGGFLGCSSLIHNYNALRQYEEAVLYAHQQPGQQPSVINASIISAERGRYGDYHMTERTRGSELWISPLMSLYWFFDLPAVAAKNIFAERLKETRTAGEAFGVIYETREQMSLRPTLPVPLP